MWGPGKKLGMFDWAACGSLAGRVSCRGCSTTGAAITGANGMAQAIQDKGRIDCTRPRSTKPTARRQQVLREEPKESRTVVIWHDCRGP